MNRSSVPLMVACFLFPTRVGMNRKWSSAARRDGTVPHASGDEPFATGAPEKLSGCSPREWG